MDSGRCVWILCSVWPYGFLWTPVYAYEFRWDPIGFLRGIPTYSMDFYAFLFAVGLYNIFMDSYRISLDSLKFL